MSQLKVQVSETGNKNLWYGVLATIGILVIIGLLGWAFSKLAQAVLPWVGLLALGVWGLWQFYSLKRPLFRAERDKNGTIMTIREWYYFILVKNSKDGDEPKSVSDSQVTGILTVVVVGVTVFLLVVYVTQLMLLISYSTNPAYQALPVSVLGLALSLHTFVKLAKLLPQTVKAFNQVDEPMKDQTWLDFIWSKITALAIAGYVITIFLIKFGVITV